MSLVSALRIKYKAPAWVVFEEVSNETGFNANRRADALAFGVWPSHGHALHGFEIKSSRSDWLRELRDPTKADTFLRYCDRFWLVAEPKVAVESEIPASWGWMERTSRGLRIRRDAPKLTPEPVPRSLWASMLRSVDKTMISKAAVDAEIERRHDILKESFARRAARTTEGYDAKELENLRAAVQRFNRLTGLTFNTYDPSATIDVIARVEQMVGTVRRLRHTLHDIQRSRERCDEAALQLDRLLSKFDLPDDEAEGT